MAEFAGSEQCAEVVESIARLILPNKADKADRHTRFDFENHMVMVAEEGSEARQGEVRGSWSTHVAFSSEVPRSWTARIHEPFMARPKYPAEKRPIPRLVVQRADLLGVDPRISHASFETYGLDVYDADQEYKWGQLDWKVMEPVSQAGRLAVFVANPYFIYKRRFTKAIRHAGHAAYDRAETHELVDAGVKRMDVWTAKEQAAIHSLRLTTEGADYLLHVLEKTKEMQDLLAKQDTEPF